MGYTCDYVDADGGAYPGTRAALNQLGMFEVRAPPPLPKRPCLLACVSSPMVAAAVLCPGHYPGRGGAAVRRARGDPLQRDHRHLARRGGAHRQEERQDRARTAARRPEQRDERLPHGIPRADTRRPRAGRPHRRRPVRVTVTACDSRAAIRAVLSSVPWARACGCTRRLTQRSARAGWSGAFSTTPCSTCSPPLRSPAPAAAPSPPGSPRAASSSPRAAAASSTVRLPLHSCQTCADHLALA